MPRLRREWWIDLRPQDIRCAMLISDISFSNRSTLAGGAPLLPPYMMSYICLMTLSPCFVPGISSACPAHMMPRLSLLFINMAIVLPESQLGLAFPLSSTLCILKCSGMSRQREEKLRGIRLKEMEINRSVSSTRNDTCVVGRCKRERFIRKITVILYRSIL